MNLNHFYHYTKNNRWLVNIVLKATDKSREVTVQAITSLIRQIREKRELEEALTEPPSLYLFNELMAVLPDIQRYAETCDEYFLLLENLVKVYKGHDFQSLLKKYKNKLLEHPVVELTASGPEDKVLIGIMNLIYSIVRKNSSLKSGCLSLVGELFTNCLFSVPNLGVDIEHSPPKCKTPKSRAAAYRLITELTREEPNNFIQLISLLTCQIENIHITEHRSISLNQALERNKCGYLGLQNQGATCYMNSLLQQLYIIPEFRKGLLEVEDKSEDKSESILYQVQYLMTSLQESVLRYHDTYDFCQSYKVDGQPVNTSQQMDAWEFFNTLFDKLEQQLKATKHEKLLRNLFGGKLVNQLIGTSGCQHRKERDEPFYTISVDIKNKEDLSEALDLFVQEEMLTGDNKYMCEECKEPVSTLKRCCIKDLPPVLVLHLKRFEFDLQSMVLKKLNSTCSFPMQLNMQHYTKEGLAIRDAQKTGEAYDGINTRPPAYYQYELYGVVVHKGTIDFGHYYSYIKERIPLTSSEPRWFEFNDTSVTAFDSNDIHKTFGGYYETEEADYMYNRRRIVRRENPNNAYILIYQRKDPNDESLVSYLAEEERQKEESLKPPSEPSTSELSNENQESPVTSESNPEYLLLILILLPIRLPIQILSLSTLTLKTLNLLNQVQLKNQKKKS